MLATSSINMAKYFYDVGKISCSYRARFDKNVEDGTPTTVKMVRIDNDNPDSDQGCHISMWPEGAALSDYALCWVGLV
jgi:hypothetical protein